MKDYSGRVPASRIPSPNTKRFNPNKKSVTMNPYHSSSTVHSHGSFAQQQQDKRERESTSTVSSGGGAQRQPPQQQHQQAPSPLHQQSPHTPAVLNANDALSLRQNGSEVTIMKLRGALDDATKRDATAKASLAKSDAVILELRTTIRTLKRQVETLQADQKEANQKHKNQSQNQVAQLQQQITSLQNQLVVSQTGSKDAKVGELQVQLDRAHAQILTADMVRKELEDTLEAEQYTWELRVQDQERQIAQLQEECDRLQEDLTAARSQWKEAEQGWNSQLEELQQQLAQARTRMAATQAMSASRSSEDLVQKINQLEKERSELQNCLDEALKELEAVDNELQSEGKSLQAGTSNKASAEVLDSLQKLLRWIYQEGPSTKNGSLLSRDPQRLLREIREALEHWLRIMNDMPSQSSTANNKPFGNRISHARSGDSNVTELQSQVAQYQDELKTREQSSSELRESLKEAVALLKPLQDAVAKAEEEKKTLQFQISEMDQTVQRSNRELASKVREIDGLKSDIEQLEQQVKEQKSIATARGSLLEGRQNSSAMATAGEGDDSLTKIQRAREELRRKRETEGNLQQLLKDAQSRFHSLHQQNEDTAARNRELQGKLQQAETQLEGPQVPSPEDQNARLEQQLRDREQQVAQLQQALQQNGMERVQQMDKELAKTREALAAKDQSEKTLNKSLKDALGLLKPLQMHLEEAEKEKMNISKELRTLRKRFRQLQMGEVDDQSKSTFGGSHQDVSIELIKIKEELEETVRQLELENSQLHDALEDMSDGGMTEGKLRQKLVEVNSRYEVTQNKLEDAHVQNHSLTKALQQTQAKQAEQEQELNKLRRLLKEKDKELTNAKVIARSALVKVEELTMTNIEQLSLTQDGTNELHFPVGAGGRF